MKSLEALMRKYSLPLATLCLAALAFAAPYLIPADPDNVVFRNGTFSALLLLACIHPVRHALQRHSLRELGYGWAFAFVFCFFLGLGSELAFYEQLLSGWSSLIRRLAVPVMAFPSVGALVSHVFAFHCDTSAKPRLKLPWIAYFLLFSVCYGCYLLANYPGILNYDFPSEVTQFFTGEYLAAHPVFHSILTGVCYHLGNTLFGSITAGAATYSAFQLLSLAAMYASVCRFAQKRLPRSCTLVLTLCYLLPFHGILAISTVKDAFFSGLFSLLCIQVWAIMESADAFLGSKMHMIGFAGTCLLLALIRHNGIFAYLPALLALVLLLRSRRRRALALCAAALAVSLLLPRSLERGLNAQKAPSTEMMSIPCQQLMRVANRVELSDEDFARIEKWFPNATHTYRPHIADPAKGGNFNYPLFSANPKAFWDDYLHYAARYPRVYLEAFLDNCMGLWYPDDVSHAHSLDGEEWDYVYLRCGNTIPKILGEIETKSYLPGLKKLLYNVAHHSRHEQLPLVSLLFRPAVYCYLLLLTTMYLCCRGRKRDALALLPVWGIFLSLVFSACILVRYAYPIMAIMPVMAALSFFGRRNTPA